MTSLRTISTPDGMGVGFFYFSRGATA